jgi:hypothetical protein
MAANGPELGFLGFETGFDDFVVRCRSGRVSRYGGFGSLRVEWDGLAKGLIASRLKDVR